MARRVSLPAADDLFRPTSPAVGESTESSVRAVPDAPAEAPGSEGGASGDDEAGKAAKPAASGRIRHDEKMTVYVTTDELMAIEQARLTLRGQHRLAVDRGRVVREAVALVLADLAANGEDSLLVHRLRDDR